MQYYFQNEFSVECFDLNPNKAELTITVRVLYMFLLSGLTNTSVLVYNFKT